ncbi:IS701 family transposase [Streptomyces sp. NPDC088253]|uniref:IS701 family transposase n=1 Tax=Streptomyces sp. NPDC088253 TaxID=3365846 RepID=UPI003806FAE5
MDETGFLKKGLRSAGVQRQYTPAAGRIENAQVGVFLAYASSRGQALIDRRLHLPEHTWCQDPDRTSGSVIPEKVEFATKPRPAWQMIEAALDAGCSSNWVTGDEVYGQDPQLRSALEARGIGYVLAVACTTKSAGAGAKGPRYYDWAWVQNGADKNRFLLIPRNPATGELAFYRCWSPGQVALAALIRVAGTRWCIEECFQAAKGQVGLDHYQARHWTSAKPDRSTDPNRPVHSCDPIDLTIPEIPPPHRHALQTTGHTAAPPSGLVNLAQAPPATGQTRPLPTTAHQPLGHLDREVTLEYQDTGLAPPMTCHPEAKVPGLRC